MIDSSNERLFFSIFLRFCCEMHFAGVSTRSCHFLSLCVKNVGNEFRTFLTNKQLKKWKKIYFNQNTLLVNSNCEWRLSYLCIIAVLLHFLKNFWIIVAILSSFDKWLSVVFLHILKIDYINLNDAFL